MNQQNGDSKRAPALKGARAMMLIRDLAVGDTSAADLAAKYGVAEQTIINFTYRHKAEIAEVAQDQLNELAGLWIARKALRVATYQNEVERNVELIEDMQEPLRGYPIPPDSDKITRLQAIVLKALAQVAGESQDQVAGTPQPVQFPVGMDWGEDDDQA